MDKPQADQAIRFQGIADPRCRRTGRYGGKFHSSWNDAVRKNNEEVHDERKMR